MADAPEKQDLESLTTITVKEKTTGAEATPSSAPDEEVATARQLQRNLKPLQWLSRGEHWLDTKLGIETQGIDRIPDEEKKPPSLWNCFLLWWTLTCHVGILPLGFVGPEFALSLQQSASAIVVGISLGSLCTAYCSILGPKTGLRAIATARYSFGYHGAKICSVINVVLSGGFGVINIVLTGQILSAVSDYKMTIAVGCVVVSVVSYALSVFGFALIHTFEKYAWIAIFVLLCVLLGQASPYIDASAPGQLTGLNYAGTWLTFMAINFASAAAWCSFAADYYCNYHAKTKASTVFVLTWLGVTLPTTFTTMLGACLGNAALSGSYAPYTEAYQSHQLGGLISVIYHPSGWSKFCLVILTFSVVGNNVMIVYSSGLSLQLLGHFFHAVPRFIWSFLDILVIAVLAIAGQDNLSTIVSNFVGLLGYWAVSFTVILFIENEWFRKGHPEQGYNLSVWNDPKRLPVGAAAVTSLLAGYLGGGLTGMAQVWYIGPIAAKFGPYGGDVGIFMSGAITAVCYPALRYLERKYTGR